jgi:hypothetical protein
MVALSGLLRFWQEHRSAKSAEALKPWCAPPQRCCVEQRQRSHPLR